MNDSKRPERIVEIDRTITKIVLKEEVTDLSVEDGASHRIYRIKRSPKKFGLQMIGNSETR